MKSVSGLLAVAALVMTSGLLSVPAQADTPKNTLVEGIAIDQVITLDPAGVFEAIGAEVIGNTYQRLVNFDIDDVSKIHGEVAKSWTVSDDGKTLTFKIRHGLKFASGNPLTAKDVVFSLQRAVILDKSPAFIIGQFGITPDNVKDRIKQTGPYQFTFTTDKRYATSFVLYTLTSSVSSVVDKKTVMAHADDGDMGYGWLNRHYAGSGPFAIRQWQANQAIVMTRNPNYAGDQPAMKQVIYRHLPEPATQQLLLQKGDIDVARNLDPDMLAAVSGKHDIATTEGRKSTIYYLGLNQKNQFLNQPKVRKALKYLVNYQAISGTLMKGIAKTHQTIVPAGFLGAVNDNPYEYDVDKARALLSEAGLADGFRVTMDVRNSPVITGIAQALQQSFAKVNIKLEIIPGSGKQTLTKYRARNHDIYIGAWGSDYPDPNSNAQTFAVTPDNGDDSTLRTLAWRNDWKVPEALSRLVEKGIQERDTEKRRRMYDKLQHKLLANSPFIVMFQRIQVMAHRRDVHGLVIGPTFDMNRFYGVTKH